MSMCVWWIDMTETDEEGHVNDTLLKHGPAKRESTDYVKRQGYHRRTQEQQFACFYATLMYLIRKEALLQPFTSWWGVSECACDIFMTLRFVWTWFVNNLHDVSTKIRFTHLPIWDHWKVFTGHSCVRENQYWFHFHYITVHSKAETEVMFIPVKRFIYTVTLWRLRIIPH